MKQHVRRSSFNVPQKPRMILKFDTGADGFLKMIYVLVGTAVVVLVTGGYFLLRHFREMNINF